MAELTYKICANEVEIDLVHKVTQGAHGEQPYRYGAPYWALTLRHPPKTDAQIREIECIKNASQNGVVPVCFCDQSRDLPLAYRFIITDFQTALIEAEAAYNLAVVQRQIDYDNRNEARNILIQQREEIGQAALIDYAAGDAVDMSDMDGVGSTGGFEYIAPLPELEQPDPFVPPTAPDLENNPPWGSPTFVSADQSDSSITMQGLEPGFIISKGDWLGFVDGQGRRWAFTSASNDVVPPSGLVSLRVDPVPYSDIPALGQEIEFMEVLISMKPAFTPRVTGIDRFSSISMSAIEHVPYI